MLISHDTDEYEMVSSSTTCPFHQANPGKSFAGCTCSVTLGQKRRPKKESDAIKLARRIKHEQKVLAGANAIRTRRKREREGKLVPAEPIDRRAAAEIGQYFAHWTDEQVDKVLNGRGDDCGMVQAIARHRIAVLASVDTLPKGEDREDGEEG